MISLLAKIPIYRLFITSETICMYKCLGKRVAEPSACCKQTLYLYTHTHTQHTHTQHTYRHTHTDTHTNTHTHTHTHTHTQTQFLWELVRDFVRNLWLVVGTTCLWNTVLVTGRWSSWNDSRFDKTHISRTVCRMKLFHSSLILSTIWTFLLHPFAVRSVASCFSQFALAFVLNVVTL